MKAIIAYTSIHHGNTEKVAKAMAKAMKAKLAKTSDVSAEAIKKYEVIGLGSGIYAGRHHPKVLELASRLSRKDVFIFSTAGIPSLKKIWHSSLRKRLEKNGCRIKGEFCCGGFDTFGPFRLVGGLQKGRPGKKNIKNAESFAKSIKQ